jgi:hypothetical protein
VTERVLSHSRLFRAAAADQGDRTDTIGVARDGLDEAMHAVVGAIVTATAQLFEQALGRATFPPRQLCFLLQPAADDQGGE